MLFEMFSVVVPVLIFVLTGIHEAQSKTEKHDHTFRIIDGQLADIKEFPHQVAISLNGSHHCGGSILSEYYILTAAHCLHELTKDYVIEVRVGSNIADKGGVLHQIEKADVHPNFTRKFENDVAVIKLAEPLKFNNKVQPVTLAKSGEKLPPAKTLALVSGWGTTDQNIRQVSPHLMSVEVPLISYKLCKKLYSDTNLYLLDDKMFCAGYLDGGADSCLGDSGGALMVDGKQYGIISWGSGCGKMDLPGVYASVSRLRNYIHEISGV